MRFLCKSCGAESPTGVGYAATVEGPLPAPAADCRHLHAGDVVLRFRGFPPIRGVGPVITEQPIGV